MAEKQNENQENDEILEQEASIKNETSEAKEPTKKEKKQKGNATQLEASLAAAETKLQKSEDTISELKDSLLRTAAEYENYRKRSQKEQESAFSNGIGYAAGEMLPILDTLEAAANAETADEEYKKGVVMTLNKCTEVFAKLNIHEITALGENFNPELHNAVMQQPVEGVESGVITQVMQKGYTLNDKVIRHAMVAVAP